MRSARILLIERDHEAQELLRLWLQLDGYLVAEAGDEAEALAIIVQEPPDLVLLDLSSFGSWRIFLTELNEMRPRLAPRVIGITSGPSGGVTVDAIRLGASDVLDKPFRREDLRLSVASVLNESSREKCGPGAGYSPTPAGS
jgi:two-component system response regulator MprA